MEWTKTLITLGLFLDILGLFLDILGVFMVAQSTLPKRLRKRLKSPQSPNNPDNDLKKWKRGIDLIYLGFALQIIGSWFQNFPRDSG